MTERTYNFYPGPATLPLPALEKAKEEFLDFAGTGMSVLEISHRSKEYDETHQKTTGLVRELMGVPDDYKILWLQGGASSQFYMVPANIAVKGKPMEFVHTGTWSKKAIAEAKLYGDVNVVASSEDEGFSFVPNPKDFEFSDSAAYAHITGNNTINGTEWQEWPEAPDNVPLVCDLSSNLMNRVMDVSNFGVLYAGAQKNLGPAGVTLLIVREDLLGRVPENTPTMQKWITHAKKDSLFNTPPVFPIYMCGLCLEHLKNIGGVPEMENINKMKAKLLYDVIDNSNGFYRGHARKDSRSLMNVTFNIFKDDKNDKELEQKCVEEGLKSGLVGLKGHRSVGGMRASIYNAMPVDGVKALCEHLVMFQGQNE